MPWFALQHTTGSFFDSAGEYECFGVNIVYQVTQAAHFEAGYDGENNINRLANVKAFF